MQDRGNTALMHVYNMSKITKRKREIKILKRYKDEKMINKVKIWKHKLHKRRDITGYLRSKDSNNLCVIDYISNSSK